MTKTKDIVIKNEHQCVALVNDLTILSEIEKRVTKKHEKGN